ncbi:MAG TPA: hypothetical protein VH417_15460 [Vicinamibacterales bacterium]|jgi:hypothetical protein
MRLVAWMVAASVASCLIAAALVDARVRAELLWGMAGPLVSAAVSWVVAERTWRQRPEAMTSVMISAFAAKLLFFGTYVAVLIRVASLEPAPFIASFAAYFIGLLFVEALHLRRLLQEKS